MSALMSLSIGAGAMALGAVAHGVLVPRSQLFGRVIHRGAPGAHGDRPRIALTFDDGPHELFTPRTLDVLKAHDVPATFFMIGRNIERATDVVRRAHEEGHIIANHSFDHAHYGTLRWTGYWMREIERTSAAIERIIGRRPAMFRPPMGLKVLPMTLAARRHEMAMITWSRRAMDGVQTSCDDIVRRLSGSVTDGDIVTMHDGIDVSVKRSLDSTVQALGPLIEAWRERGLTLCRLDELLDRPAYQD